MYLFRNEDSPFSISETLLAFASGILKVGGPDILNFLMTKLNQNLMSNQVDKELEMFLHILVNILFNLQDLSPTNVLEKQNLIFEEIQAIQTSQVIN